MVAGRPLIGKSAHFRRISAPIVESRKSTECYVTASASAVRRERFTVTERTESFKRRLRLS
jgi:hypothetical protein